MHKENNFSGCSCSPLVFRKRLYIRVSDGHGKQSWKPVGWYCEHCKEVTLE